MHALHMYRLSQSSNMSLNARNEREKMATKCFFLLSFFLLLFLDDVVICVHSSVKYKRSTMASLYGRIASYFSICNFFFALQILIFVESFSYTICIIACAHIFLFSFYRSEFLLFVRWFVSFAIFICW